MRGDLSCGVHRVGAEAVARGPGSVPSRRAAMHEIELNLTVNGEPVLERVPPDMTLLTFLRDRLGLTGAKNGCSEGTCGACTVLVDGRPVRSCREKVEGLRGTVITTIEGLSRMEVPIPYRKRSLVRERLSVASVLRA